MKRYICGEEAFTTYKWRDGISHEVAIFPEDRTYREENFLWRIAINETVDKRADLPSIKNYEHSIAIIEGSPQLELESQHTLKLEPYALDRFHGGWAARAYGNCKYLDVMVRKGNEAYMDLIESTEEKQDFIIEGEVKRPFRTIALYVAEGTLEIETEGAVDTVSEGEVYYIEYAVNENAGYTLKGEAIVIRTQIFFGKYAEDSEKEKEESNAKPTFKDFLLCMYLANMKVKIAKYIFPRRRNEWFDPELSRITKKLDKGYIGAVLFVIAAILIVKLTGVDGEVVPQTFIWLLVSFLAIIFIIDPLIYFIFVPKPVAKHIKKVKDLTPYERMMRDQELEAELREMKEKSERRNGINMFRR